MTDELRLFKWGFKLFEIGAFLLSLRSIESVGRSWSTMTLNEFNYVLMTHNNDWDFFTDNPANLLLRETEGQIYLFYDVILGAE